MRPKDDPRAEASANFIKTRHPELAGLHASDLAYYSWPEMYGSTAGPFGGLGGQMMTSFQLEAWEYAGYAVVFCGQKMLKYTEHFGFSVDWQRPQNR